MTRLLHSLLEVQTSLLTYVLQGHYSILLDRLFVVFVSGFCSPNIISLPGPVPVPLLFLLSGRHRLTLVCYCSCSKVTTVTPLFGPVPVPW